LAIINGTPNDDRFENALVGTDEDDVISGLEGRDELIGNAGNDTLVGREGDRDYASYITSPGPISGNLTTNRVSDGFGGTDTLIDITEIRGSRFNDTLIGAESGDILLWGRDGDDTLIGNNNTNQGGTQLNGGNGNDTLTTIGGSYSFMEPGAGNDTITGSTSFDILSYFYTAGYDLPPRNPRHYRNIYRRRRRGRDRLSRGHRYLHRD
jgi:Ca2+-binding RTX toxin-like protein